MNINLFHPFPYQLEIINNLKKYPHDIHVLKSKRQIGKSILDANILIYYSLKNKDQSSVILCPTLSQARKIFKDICKWLKGSKTIENANASLLEIEFINGSVIYFKSAEQRDSLRGYTVTANGILIIDESAYISDEIISMVLPFVDANNAPILLTSTPRWKEGFFYKWYTQGLNNQNGIHTVDVNDYDTSNLLTETKLEFYRKQLPTQIFRSDYLGYFLESESDVFGDFSTCINDNYDKNNKRYNIGIDWGSGGNQDYTALVTFNSDRQMVDVDYFNDKSPVESIKYITEKISKISPEMVTVEKNSIGSIYYDMLEVSLKNIKRDRKIILKYFNTTNESKRKIIENFISDVQQNKISLLNNPELKIELSAYQMEKTKNGGITYNAASGYHDDLVMATAICLDSFSVKKFNADNIMII